MSIIHRTSELASITHSVIAIGNSRRLAARRRTVGRSERMVLVFETLQNGDWGHEKDAELQPIEKKIDTVRNRMGGMGAYCEVVPTLELRKLASDAGLRWCAIERASN